MKHSPHDLITRRRALAALGLAGGVLAIGDGLLLSSAGAAETDPNECPLLATFNFGGGWDTLLSLDPRDHTNPKFANPGGAIRTGYELLAAEDPQTAAFLEKPEVNNTGIWTPTGSNIGFGLTMESLAELFDELCIIRGINMGTLSHEVGQLYALTGKFPRGISPSGSALGTWWVHQTTPAFLLPNFAFRNASYNEGLDPAATALQVNSYIEIASVLKALKPTLAPRGDLAQALAKFQRKDTCMRQQLDVTGLVNIHQASYEQSLPLSEGLLWDYFNFGNNPADGSEAALLYEHFGINKANAVGESGQLNLAAGRALVAAQAITKGISQAVSLSAVDSSLDTHEDNWADVHVFQQRGGWNLVKKFIDYMKTTKDPNGKPYWDRMTVVCTSEFSRGPLINARLGRDHFLYTSMLVAGNGIKGNQVVGMTNEENYHGVPFDFATGQPSENGTYLRPSDVHATILKAAGLPYDNLSNQSPKLIDAVLDS